MSLKAFRYLKVMVALLALAGLMLPSAAKALPAFARQTDQPCTTCHVGAFGPQLTDFGRDFKLNGYVWGKDDVKPWEHLAVMAYGGLEVYSKGQSVSGPNPGGPLSTFSSNDNLALDQVSLFYGGRIYDKIGTFAQITYADPQRSFHWDNTDVRYADTGNVGDFLVLYGVSINNNPTVQDVWQTAPAWAFPYVASGVAGSVLPQGVFQPLLASGALAQHVIGTTAYVEVNDRVYAEFGGYTGLSQGPSLALGMTGTDTADRLHGFNPYWRLNYDSHDGEETIEFGTFGMDTQMWPGNFQGGGSDHRTDIALDVNYQRFLDDNKHIFSFYGSAIRELAELQGTAAATGADPNLSMTTLNGNASYYYENTYGVTVGRSVTVGSQNASYGTPTNKPDNSFWTVQFDVTPFGSDTSLAAPYLNLRFFAQYIMYDKLAGATSNFDGNGRNPGDNNTFFLGVWTAF